LVTLSKSSRSSEYTLRRRVQFRETDAAGIVHFSCFFLYMEEAEHALWREAGLSIARGHAGVGFPRVSAGFDYHRALHFEDEVDVTIRIAAIDDKTIRYTCVLTRGEERIASGAMKIICVGREHQGGPMKARSIPADIAARFEVAAEAAV
jgi:YbgC/YbaW family acyl-CoA thioester hydrolase